MTPEYIKDNKIVVICTNKQQANKLAQRWKPGYSSGNWEPNIHSAEQMAEVCFFQGLPSWQDGKKGTYFIENHGYTKSIQFSEVDFGEGIKYNYLIL